MNSEIQIILHRKNPYSLGNCFEKLIRDIIESHRYRVSSNVNYTGMELDLTAKHLDRANELLYVECKAKQKVSSSEILTFESKVRLKKVDFGYFVRTKELEHQAKGLIDEFKQDQRYTHLTFFEPIQVIGLLQDSNKIERVTIPTNTTKQILALTHFGDFYIFILKESLAAIPKHFNLIDAKTGQAVIDEKISDVLKKTIDEITDLHLLHAETPKNINVISEKSLEIESISEVQESENWYDYLPASTKHIVGRDQIRSDFFNFLSKVSGSQTSRRVFYLTGKSGWGKSSLISDIRGRCRNKYYKKKYYTLAIDSRSALSSNFVAICFERLIKRAYNDGFLKRSLFSEELEFTSTFDLLSSNSIKSILRYLREHNKVLILIFDQFEDVFSKKDLFKNFYKFLTDITDAQSNLVVGFSWKTEILIPSENEAYHLWQQAKEQAEPFSISDFGSKEINGLISQLEGSIGKIEIELKRRLVESSQNFPWLTKKLCIHIYDQISKEKDKDDLIDENLNIEQLFKSDLEKLNSAEVQGIKYIAQRASDGSFFDASEVGDLIPELAINSLRDKRLIIRSGLNYNIYWDIFRDYLVTGEAPKIGESYILRTGAKSCLAIFLTFDEGASNIALTKIHERLNIAISVRAVENSLIDLRAIGLIKKSARQQTYRLADTTIKISEDFFKNFVNEKFLSYTIYQQIKELSGQITREAVIEIFKTSFKGYVLKDKTWYTYANTIMNWISYLNNSLAKNFELRSKITFSPTFSKSRKINYYERLLLTKETAFLRSTPNQFIRALKDNITAVDFAKLDSRIFGDLVLLEFLELKNSGFEFTDLGLKALKENPNELICEQAYKIPSIRTTTNFLHNKDRVKSKELLNIFPNLIEGTMTEVLSENSKIIHATYLMNWARFILKNIEIKVIHNK